MSRDVIVKLEKFGSVSGGSGVSTLPRPPHTPPISNSAAHFQTRIELAISVMNDRGLINESVLLIS